MKHNEWISLEIERPEIATWVLGLCTKGGYWLCFRANGGWYITTKYGQRFFQNDDENREIKMAYWISIPELPKELQEKLFPLQIPKTGWPCWFNGERSEPLPCKHYPMHPVNCEYPKCKNN